VTAEIKTPQTPLPSIRTGTTGVNKIPQELTPATNRSLRAQAVPDDAPDFVLVGEPSPADQGPKGRIPNSASANTNVGRVQTWQRVRDELPAKLPDDIGPAPSSYEPVHEMPGESVPLSPMKDAFVSFDADYRPPHTPPPLIPPSTPMRATVAPSAAEPLRRVPRTGSPSSPEITIEQPIDPRLVAEMREQGLAIGSSVASALASPAGSDAFSAAPLGGVGKGHREQLPAVPNFAVPDAKTERTVLPSTIDRLRDPVRPPQPPQSPSGPFDPRAMVVTNPSRPLDPRQFAQTVSEGSPAQPPPARRPAPAPQAPSSTPAWQPLSGDLAASFPPSPDEGDAPSWAADLTLDPAPGKKR
jgi:hypothetical protein